MWLDVCVSSPKEVIFEGKARNVILPGEQGVFEVLPFHRSILSRLISGTLVIDEQTIRIRRGVVRVHYNKVTVIVEEA